MLIVSVVVVAALTTVGAAGRGQSTIVHRRQGDMLAQSLMAEILREDYADASFGVDSFGRSVAEDATGDRSLFDDVDDYDGWFASPPEDKDGSVLPNLAGWSRGVEVVWLKRSSLDQTSNKNDGLKRITVRVEHKGDPVAELEAIKTVGLPVTEACCLPDGSCMDLLPTDCWTVSGTPQGEGTDCVSTSCIDLPSLAILMVVNDASAPTDQEMTRKRLLEAWGFSVDLLTAADAQSAYDSAMANNDLAYVPATVDWMDVTSKLTPTEKGVVNELGGLFSSLGFSSGSATSSGTTMDIVDDTHDITAEFWLGRFTLVDSAQPLTSSQGDLAPGINVLSELTAGYPMLAYLERGDAMVWSGNAAGRRVKMPWGGTDFDFNELTMNARIIFREALVWAGSTPNVGATLFYDDFESYAIGSTADPPWLATGSAYAEIVDDGGNQVLWDGDSGGAPIVVGESTWTDVVVSQDFRSLNGDIDHAGLIARYVDSSNMIYGGIVEHNEAEIWVRISGSWSLLGHWSIPSVGTTWHSQALRVEGDTVELFIDDAPIGSVTLPGGAPTEGKTGFWSQYGGREGYRDNHHVQETN
jgi:hypothetical protein